jgi:hypothetical protein
MKTKVVKILSETEVVLGGGSTSGIQEGMEFVIYEDGDEIIDPETKESLGTLEVVKGYVTIVNVQPKLSIAKTHSRTITRTKRVPHGIAAWVAMTSGYREEEFEVERIEKLRVEKPDPIYEKQLIVRVGDKAKLTRE